MPLPTCIHITGARQHDVGWLDSLFFEAGAFYLMDRGYMDFVRLGLIANAGAFFVSRAKTNLQFTRHYSKIVIDSPDCAATMSEKPLSKNLAEPFQCSCAG